MIDLAFLSPNERTAYSDELYAVIGRALAIATHYEANLRVLVVALEVRHQRSALIEVDKLEETIEELWQQRLNSNIGKLMSRTRKSLGIRATNPEEAKAANEFVDFISEKLHKARKARNAIAHESAIGIEAHAEDEQYRRGVIQMIEEHVRCIAEADFHVAGVIEYLNGASIAPSLEMYIEETVMWVCDTEC